MFVFLSQNNEYLQERLLQKGPTITERSKKVWNSLLIHWLHTRWRCTLCLLFVKCCVTLPCCAVLPRVCPSFLTFCLMHAGIRLLDSERIKGTTTIEEICQNEMLSLLCFFLMCCLGAPCAWLKRPSPQDGGRWLGVEWRWAGWGKRGRQSCCGSSEGETACLCLTSSLTSKGH